MKTFRLSMLLLLLMAISLMACEKYKLEKRQEMILGTWVSLDETDTLDIADESNFYKTVAMIPHERFNYELFRDSIKIVYSGSMYILVYPTRHSYSLEEDRLTIDFSNRHCYGFTRQETTYFKDRSE